MLKYNIIHKCGLCIVPQRYIGYFCNKMVITNVLTKNDRKILVFCFRKASQGGTGGAISKSHHGARGNNGNSMNNVPGNRGGWTSRGGSKNQLVPDKQQRQNGMLSNGKKGDQGKMPLSKSVWQHSIPWHTTLQL
jgi:hypothetical protein